MRLLDAPDALRDMGLEPILVAGWENRGYDFPVYPIGSLDHDTVGPTTGFMPSLGVLTVGRDGLPGPLANLGLPRLMPGDWRVYVIAAGKANHAGKGYWQGADSNYDLVGLERESRGGSTPPEYPTSHRNEAAARVHAAMARLCGFSAKNVARHAEYALPVGRKIDSFAVLGTWLRSRVTELLVPGVPPEDDDMAFDDGDKLRLKAVFDALYVGPDGLTQMDKNPLVGARVMSMHAGNYGEGNTNFADGSLAWFDKHLGAAVNTILAAIQSGGAGTIDVPALAAQLREGLGDDLADILAARLARPA